MHELSIAEGLLQRLREISETENNAKIVSVSLVTGRISGVDAEALEFAFNALAEDGPAAGAKLLIEKVPLRVKCLKCGLESVPSAPFPLCENCGSFNTEILSGKEFYIKSAEIEERERE
jgi:hydrogenase nickel incorporation protein HypA/HybF